MAKYKKQRELLFSNQRQTQISQFLNKTQSLYFIQIKDERGNTVLHHSAFLNNQYLIKKYITKAKQIACTKNYFQRGEKKKIQEWINLKNQDGFTPLHYAAYKGNLQIMRYLQRQGADFLQKTKSGLNMLHLAAQNDKVKTFIYYNQKISINSRDLKLSTPLHWASYMNSQNAVNYILGHPQKQLDLKDTQLQTPLHLASGYGNTGIVKKLLLAGCDKSIQNYKKQTPLKIAQDNDFPFIRNMLKDEFSYLEKLKLYCNLKNTYKPESRSWIKPILFIILFILFVFHQYCQYMQDLWEKEYFYGGFSLNGLAFLLYLSLLINPSKKQKIKLHQMLKNQYKQQQICFYCLKRKQKRQNHCNICKVCINKYDHHCYWINNCVGKNNLRRFIFFLFIFIINLLWFSFLNIYVIIEYPENNTSNINNIITLPKQYFYVINGIIALFCIIIFPFILFLLFVQLKNIYLNKTTFERFSKNTKSKLSNSHVVNSNFKVKKQNQKGNIKNLFLTLCCCCKFQNQELQRQSKTINQSIQMLQ